MGNKHSIRHKRTILAIMAAAVPVMDFLCLCAGSSGMSISECIPAIFGHSTNAHVRIMQQIRLPRIIAAIAAGAGLSMAGLIMQTTLAETYSD